MLNKNIFGVNFTDVSLETLADMILSKKLNFNVVVTPNVDHVVRINSNIQFNKLYEKADVCVNDSRILRILSKIIRKPINNLVPGSDLTALLFERLKSNEDIKLAVIGCNETVISKLKKAYSINTLAHYNPPMNFHNSEVEINKCVDVCRESEADIVFLAVGSPKQELVAKHLKDAGVPGCYLCIGASLLFLAGEETRAPLFIQKLHCEWLFRLLQNPRRMTKRYLIDGPKIIPIVIKEVLK